MTNETINIPNWVKRGMEPIYKQAYLECRNNLKLSKLPSTQRKKWIIERGNQIIQELINRAKAQKEELNKENRDERK